MKHNIYTSTEYAIDYDNITTTKHYIIAINLALRNAARSHEKQILFRDLPDDPNLVSEILESFHDDEYYIVDYDQESSSVQIINNKL